MSVGVVCVSLVVSLVGVWCMVYGHIVLQGAIRGHIGGFGALGY